MIARMNLGNHYSRHGQYELAYEQYKEFARVRPDWSRAWTSCARTAVRLGLRDEAERHYLRGIDVAEGKNPRAYSVRKEYADFLRSEGRVREALAQYEIVLQKSPPNAAQVRTIVERLRRRLYGADPPASPVSP
jgi:tetratricopeptide (TPR) repeat protein